LEIISRDYDPDTDTFTIKLKKGFVHHNIPKTDIDCNEDPIPIYYDNGTTRAEHTDETEIPVPNGSTVYLEVKREKPHGKVKNGSGDQPAIKVAATVPDSDHWHPDDPDGTGGADGTESWPIVKLEHDGTDTTVTVYHVGPFYFHCDITPLVKVGSGFNIWQEWKEEDGAHYFRTVADNYGIAISDGETLTWDFDAENVDQSGQDIFVDPPDPLTDTKAQFRQLDGRGAYYGDTPDAGTSEQIKIVTDGATPPGIVRAIGNGRTGNLRYETCEGDEIITLEINDGLSRLTKGGVVQSGATVIVPACPATTT
jgi:hypothetical protein